MRRLRPVLLVLFAALLMLRLGPLCTPPADAQRAMAGCEQPAGKPAGKASAAACVGACVATAPNAPAPRLAGHVPALVPPRAPDHHRAGATAGPAPPPPRAA